jgi:hypothetical protein
MTEENLYQKFSLHISVIAIIFYGLQEFIHVACKEIEKWVTNPLK